MKIQQLSLFLENKPGHLSSICRAIAEAGINIETLSLADTQQFGILRVIVQDWEKAEKTLQENGFVVKVTEVVAIEVPNRPGGVAELLAALDETDINIEYMYAWSDRGILIFRFDDPDKAVKILQENGRNVLGDVELFQKG